MISQKCAGTTVVSVGVYGAGLVYVLCRLISCMSSAIMSNSDGHAKLFQQTQQQTK